MLSRYLAIVLAATPMLCLLPPAFGADAAPTRPKLVLMITVDQLRGDMLPRFAHRFGDGGFRRILDGGVYYADAHYDHSTTFTAVGHATLFTGGGPLQHGIAGNDWVDPGTGQQVYCVEDDRGAVLGKPAKPHEGTGPRNLTSTTIGDELVVATGGRAKVFSISGKDRGAILPGGHRGKVFWYDKDTGRFVTSSYYYAEYPPWAATWNDAGHSGKLLGTKWELTAPRESYVYASQDDRPFERPFKNLGRTFPHPLGDSPSPDFFAGLRFTPVADELTVEFAKAAIDAERLGADDVPDLLAVGLSATDYLGHAFGPDSLEYEDNLLRLDRTIASLLSYVDEKVGLGATLVVLASDHGVDQIPEGRLAEAAARRNPLWRRAVMPTTSPAGSAVATEDYGCGAGRHVPEKFIPAMNERLKARLGVDASLVTAFWNPSLYLDERKLRELKLDTATVERVLAEEVVQMPGFSRAFTRTDLLAGRVPNDAVGRAVMEAFNPQRSGHVMLVQKPFWYLYNKAEEFAAMHGSPYAYDTFVPLVISGPGVPRGLTVRRRVSPRDVAPTVAARLGILPPSGSTGRVLVEVFGAPHGPAAAAALTDDAR